MKYLLLTVLTTTLIAGCASHANKSSGGVIIDRRGVNMSQYYLDLEECQTYASEVPTAHNAATGAASGAAVGGLVGAVIDERRSLEKGAGVGAIVGGARGIARSQHKRHRVIRNCLRGRGYRVLN